MSRELMTDDVHVTEPTIFCEARGLQNPKQGSRGGLLPNSGFNKLHGSMFKKKP